jgi:hypothetical protein
MKIATWPRSFLITRLLYSTPSALTSNKLPIRLLADEISGASTMVRVLSSIVLAFQLAFLPAAQALQAKSPNVLFEGYSKVLLKGVHVGFVILRYEFDPAKKQFKATYLVKTDDNGGNILESLKAVSDLELRPISYEYTSLVGKSQTKVIDAKFSKDKMSATIKSGKTQKKVVENIPKGTFLGIFLYYVILRSPTGMKTDSTYNYKAVAEEDAKVYDGIAVVKNEEKFNGIRAFRATNKFKDQSYNFYLTDAGEALMTDSPLSNVKTILVAKPEEATANQKIPTAILKSLFGGVPAGTANTVAKNLQGEAIRQNQPTPTKQYGIQPDSRIMINKGEPPKQEKENE